MQQQFRQQDLNELLNISQDRSFDQHQTLCQKLLKNSNLTERIEGLQPLLEQWVWHFTNHLVVLAMSEPSLLDHCRSNQNCQKNWENYLNSVLKSNDTAKKINPKARQNLFDTLIGTYLTVQASTHTTDSGALTDAGMTLINQAMHYQSVYAATFLLSHILSSKDVDAISTQLPKFKALIPAHGAVGCQLAVIAYSIFANKNMTQDDSTRAQLALKQALSYAYMAEQLAKDCIADLDNYDLVRFPAPFDPGSFQATQNTLSKQFGTIIDQAMIDSSVQDGQKMVTTWRSANLENCDANKTSPTY